MTEPKLRLASRIVLVAVALTLAWPFGPVAAAEPTPELKAVIEAAKKEGALELSWGQGTLGGSRYAKIIEQRFNGAYGTAIRLKYTPGGNMMTTANEIAMRQSVRQPSMTDVFVGYSDAFAQIHEKKAFLPAEYQKFLPGRITGEIVEEDGAVVTLATTLAGASYNPNLVPYPPKKLTDFLKPEWTGKIASTPYVAHFDVLAARGVWGPDKALDYARQLSKQIAGLMRCGEGERIASGEFIAFVMNCSLADFSDAIAKGAPIRNVMMSDFPVLFHIHMAVPKNAVNPNAAKLFVTYLSTPDGQKLLYESSGFDLSYYPESRIAKEIAAAKTEHGVEFVSTGIKWYLDHPETVATSKKIADVIVKR